ncbi:MAG: hypothetical protein Q8835_02565 [Sweet potato little leaf phytoplasma]|nr:hypothetical protein [Sweet potato little leaf phytoplasma]
MKKRKKTGYRIEVNVAVNVVMDVLGAAEILEGIEVVSRSERQFVDERRTHGSGTKGIPRSEQRATKRWRSKAIYREMKWKLQRELEDEVNGVVVRYEWEDGEKERERETFDFAQRNEVERGRRVVERKCRQKTWR